MLKMKVENPEELEEVNLRAADRKKTREKTMLVNEVIDKIRSGGFRGVRRALGHPSDFLTKRYFLSIVF